jgi:hypothetical protein
MTCISTQCTVNYMQKSHEYTGQKVMYSTVQVVGMITVPNVHAPTEDKSYDKKKTAYLSNRSVQSAHEILHDIFCWRFQCKTRARR